MDVPLPSKSSSGFIGILAFSYDKLRVQMHSIWMSVQCHVSISTKHFCTSLVSNYFCFLMSSKRFILCLLAMIAFACPVLAMNYLIEFRNSTFFRASKHHSHSNGDEVQRERIICGFFTMILFCYCNDAFHICMFRFSNCTCQAPRTQTTAEILTVRIE